MNVFSFLWIHLSLLLHLLLFGLPFGYLSSIITKRGGKNAERNSLIIIFSSIFIVVPATIYIHHFNPQAKEIFYAKLFTYPAFELKFDFPEKVSNDEVTQIIRVLVKEFPHAEYKSPARTLDGIKSSEKYIPNYWKVTNNSLYYYFSRPPSQQKIERMKKGLSIRFSNHPPLISNKISLKRHDETFPIQFYFDNINKGILPNETEELTHTINLQTFDIRLPELPKNPNLVSPGVTSQCVVRFAINDQYWTKKLHAFQQFLKSDKVARRAFAIDKTKTEEEINIIATQFILKLKYSVTFSNKLTYPAKIFIDSNGNSNVVAIIGKDSDLGIYTNDSCLDLSYEVFPSLMPIYIKKSLLADIPDGLKIKKVTAKRLRFSPFYTITTPVSGLE